MTARCTDCGILFDSTSEDAGDPACLCPRCFRALDYEGELTFTTDLDDPWIFIAHWRRVADQLEAIRTGAGGALDVHQRRAMRQELCALTVAMPREITSPSLPAPRPPGAHRADRRPCSIWRLSPGCRPSIPRPS